MKKHDSRTFSNLFIVEKLATKNNTTIPAAHNL